LAEFRIIWNSKHISIQKKLSIIRTCGMSVVLYACETWTLRKQDKNALLAFEMKCYRRILHIRWQQKVTNKEIRPRVGTTKNIIVGVILERKLNLFGHICRMEEIRLVKNVVFDIWLDDIKEWCHEDIHTLSRKAHDRDLWRRTVNYAVNTNGQELME